MLQLASKFLDRVREFGACHGERHEVTNAVLRGYLLPLGVIESPVEPRAALPIYSAAL